MKGQSLTPEQKRYILENRDKKFLNQIAVELGVCQTTVRNIIKKNTE